MKGRSVSWLDSDLYQHGASLEYSENLVFDERVRGFEVL